MKEIYMTPMETIGNSYDALGAENAWTEDEDIDVLADLFDAMRLSISRLQPKTPQDWRIYRNALWEITDGGPLDPQRDLADRMHLVIAAHDAALAAT